MSAITQLFDQYRKRLFEILFDDGAVTTPKIIPEHFNLRMLNTLSFGGF